MRTICLYFQVHQPFRLKRYRFFDIGADHYYYDDFSNKSIARKIAENCYLPANKIMLDLIGELGSKFKVAYSVSGMALEQFERYAPEVIESFKKLAATGQVEFLAETYAHSLASLTSKEEFFRQVQKHSRKIEQLFGQTPRVFRNTELIYSDGIGEMVSEMGFDAMLTEGAKHILGWKSPNYLYFNPSVKRLKLILKNYKLSDDIAFRFSDRNWSSWPLTAEKYVTWLKEIPKKEEVLNLFMDYETFGEHQWAETGIFDFLRAFPKAVLQKSDYEFHTPSEVAANLQPVAPIHVPYAISWADEERDISAWLGNELQWDAFNTLYRLRDAVARIDDPEIWRDWEYLQTSDHFYYMRTKFFASDADVHKYFSPYTSPYDAFINYMNAVSDFADRVNKALKNADLEAIPENISEEEAEKLIRQHEEAIELLKKKAAPKKAAKKQDDTPAPEVQKKPSAKKVSKTTPKTEEKPEAVKKAPAKKSPAKKDSSTQAPPAAKKASEGEAKATKKPAGKTGRTKKTDTD